jgi:protein-S-isoprenylcysteine O-methyltransferase Ste14
MNTMWTSVLLVLGWAPMLVGIVVKRDSVAAPVESPVPDALVDAASTDRMLVGMTWVLCIAVTALALIDLRRAPDPARDTEGVALFLAGMAAWSWARAVQGAHFAQIARAPRALVTQAPYSFVRHPMYLATAIGTAGQALAAGSLRAAAVWCALVLVLAVRSCREEFLLRAAFGSAWDAYARHSIGFLRPRP